MPDYDNDAHSVEFEAPLSSDNIVLAKKHFSIDLSLELERQLDMESFSSIPAYYQNIDVGRDGNKPAHDVLDPQVLAHIVKQLQQALTEITRDRDELREQIAVSHSHEAELQDALQHMIDKATAMDVELTAARKKMKDDEEAITLLRAKVEESRRGLMRLQVESRRQSLAPIDIAGVASSAKRGTFTPITGSFTARPGHRRIASVHSSPTNSAFAQTANTPTLTFPDNSIMSISHGSSRKHSNLLGRTSPQPDAAPDRDQLVSQVEVLRQELRSVKDMLEQTKHELTEANEAREASQMCAKVLRDFIEENNVGAVDPDTASVTSLKLPPPPTMASGVEDEEVALQSKKTTLPSWGFGKLWGDSTVKASPDVSQSESPVAPHVTPTPSTPMSANPLSRKIGGFFSSRTSTTSVVSSMPTNPIPSVATPSIRESIYSASDTSSVVEPASPPEEYNTLVVVRDVTNISDSSTGVSPDLGKEVKIQPLHQLQVMSSR